MFERFTDRARRVMQMANQEAQRFNHEQIGTQHILLGILKEGDGVAANVLKNLDIDLRMARLEVEKLVQPGPDTNSMGKLPFTVRAHKVLNYAIEEARNLNHNHVGTEHLLLGLLRDTECVAVQVLRNLGLTVDVVRADVAILFPPKPVPTEEETRIKDASAKLNTCRFDTIIMMFKELSIDERFKLQSRLMLEGYPELKHHHDLMVYVESLGDAAK